MASKKVSFDLCKYDSDCGGCAKRGYIAKCFHGGCGCVLPSKKSRVCLILLVFLALVMAHCHKHDFVPSLTFVAPKPGYVFKNGPRGVGYYRDVRDERT